MTIFGHQEVLEFLHILLHAWHHAEGELCEREYTMSGVLVVSCTVAMAANTIHYLVWHRYRYRYRFAEKSTDSDPKSKTSTRKKIAPSHLRFKEIFVFDKSSDPLFPVSSRWLDVILTPEDRKLPPYQVTPLPPWNWGNQRGKGEKSHLAGELVERSRLSYYSLFIVGV